MKFIETSVPGAFLIELEPVWDDRGMFARSFCRREFLARGLNPEMLQCSVSRSRRRGTLRGMHYQKEPDMEAKLVRCTRGAMYDVILDLRAGSAGFLRWTAVEMSEEKLTLLHVPEGVAHGFQTLTDDVEVMYQMSAYHEPRSAAGVRWNDPAFGIRWPDAERTISETDAGYPDFRM